jgi:hypothetical protein
MKLREAVMGALLMGLCFCFVCGPGDALAKGAEDPVLTVLNPLGAPPPIKLKAMAPRLDTIEGKTIYVDNNGFPGTSVLLPELIAVMKEKYPTTTFIYNDKPVGSMVMEQDPAAGKADAIIIATGH